MIHGMIGEGTINMIIPRRVFAGEFHQYLHNPTFVLINQSNPTDETPCKPTDMMFVL